MQKTIFITGISGVGKTTFLKALSLHIKFQHLTASDIIKDQKQHVSSMCVSSEELRLANIDDNQKLLINGFNRLKDPNVRLVIVDGHTIIDTPNGLVTVERAVFEGLEIDQFIFLKEKPEIIFERRRKDLSRTRPQIEVHLIDEHQHKALAVAREYAETMGLSMVTANTSELDKVIAAIS